MPLINAFDSGPCQIALVHRDDDRIVWQGYLTKGQSSGNVPGWNSAGGGEVVNVAVTSDGQVTLTNIAGTLTDGYDVRVIPDKTFLSGQVQAISLPGRSPQPSGIGFSPPGTYDDIVLSYSGTLGAVTPDPCVLPDSTRYIGVFIGEAV